MHFDAATHVPGVYILLSKNGSKGYVGSTGDLRRRLLRHERDLKAGKHFNAALQELYDYHMGNLDVILFPMETRDAAYDYEQIVLDSYMSSSQLCNIATNAREPGANFRLSDEHKAKLIAGNTGRPKSKEHRAAISKSLTGKPLDPVRAAKMRIIRVGARNTATHKAKIAAKFLGVRKSETARQRMSEAKSQAVIVDGEVYRNYQGAADTFGISKVAVGKRIKNPNFPGWSKKEK